MLLDVDACTEDIAPVVARVLPGPQTVFFFFERGERGQSLKVKINHGCTVEKFPCTERFSI